MDREVEPTAVNSFPLGLVTLGDRVQQPGELVGTRLQQPHAPYHTQAKAMLPIAQAASSKFSSIVQLLSGVLPIQAYQLLPVDPKRKVAHITVRYTGASGFAVLFGDESTISNYVYSSAATQAAFIPIPGTYLIAAIATNGIIAPYDFTCKQSLWACLAISGDWNNGVFVQCIVETFDGDTPIN